MTEAEAPPPVVMSDRVAVEAKATRLRNREARREEWRAWWKVQDIESRGTVLGRFCYYSWMVIDTPVTLFRERVAEPLQDRFKLPFYHRRFSRSPLIDECAVDDQACIYEANIQYKLDKQVDWAILRILRDRDWECKKYYGGNRKNVYPCAKVILDYEQAELNFFIKYGELGAYATAKDVYMKQKHRLIWERRHPEVMEERARQVAENKRRFEEDGVFDESFWKAGKGYHDMRFYEVYEFTARDSPAHSHDKPLSKDWQYYKKKAADPDFDKGAEHRSTQNYWPW